MANQTFQVINPPVDIMPTPAESTPGSFTMFDPMGKQIMSGSLSSLTEPIMDSKSRAMAQSLVTQAADSYAQLRDLARRERELNTRADGLNQAEAAIQRAAFEEDKQRFCNSVNEFEARLDAFEQRKIADMMASLPTPGDPGTAPAEPEPGHGPDLLASMGNDSSEGLLPIPGTSQFPESTNPIPGKSQFPDTETNALPDPPDDPPASGLTNYSTTEFYFPVEKDHSAPR
jgi:hypothetical protein